MNAAALPSSKVSDSILSYITLCAYLNAISPALINTVCCSFSSLFSSSSREYSFESGWFYYGSCCCRCVLLISESGKTSGDITFELSYPFKSLIYVESTEYYDLCCYSTISNLSVESFCIYKKFWLSTLIAFCISIIFRAYMSSKLTYHDWFSMNVCWFSFFNSAKEDFTNTSIVAIIFSVRATSFATVSFIRRPCFNAYSYNVSTFN